jgi:hypothetical protein
MPALLLTLVSRTGTFLSRNNPHGELLAVDPFAEAPPLVTMAGNGTEARRGWLSRATPAPAPPVHPVLSDGLSVAQIRALTWMTRHLDAAAEARQRVQARRRRSDAEIFDTFPLHVVPTYAGDETLFAGTGFRSWLPESPRLVFRTLAEVAGRT